MEVSSRTSSSSGSSGDGGSSAGAGSVQQVMSMQDMQKYSREGYKLLGRSGSGTFDPAMAKQQHRTVPAAAPGAGVLR